MKTENVKLAFGCAYVDIETWKDSDNFFERLEFIYDNLKYRTDKHNNVIAYIPEDKWPEVIVGIWNMETKEGEICF